MRVSFPFIIIILLPSIFPSFTIRNLVQKRFPFGLKV